MIRTYKKKSKNKITRGGSNTNKAATKIQTAYRSKKASTLRKKNSAVKKIQSSARKAFAFAEDKCPICIETNFVKNNVTTLPCGHKIHKICLEQLKNSNVNRSIPLKCPTCRRDVKVDDDLDNFIRTIVGINLTPALASAENMSNLISLFKIRTANMSSIQLNEIWDYIEPIIRILNLRWERLNEKLDMINKSIRYSTGEKKGKIKSKIGKPTLESLSERYLPSVFAYKKYLEDYHIVIPYIINEKIEEIKVYFVEKGFDMPTQEEITRINSVM